jgi:hypothetical protein
MRFIPAADFNDLTINCNVLENYGYSQIGSTTLDKNFSTKSEKENLKQGVGCAGNCSTPSTFTTLSRRSFHITSMVPPT